MPNTGISGCAKRAITEQDGTVRPIEVRHDGDAGACLAGVRCCGSTWFCPRCSPKILYRRGEEIDRICQTVFEHGGSIFLLTLTVRHSIRDRAKRLVDFVIPALSRLLKGGDEPIRVPTGEALGSKPCGQRAVVPQGSPPARCSTR